MYLISVDCSTITAKLVETKLKVDPQYIVSVPLQTETTITVEWIENNTKSEAEITFSFYGSY